MQNAGGRACKCDRERCEGIQGDAEKKRIALHFTKKALKETNILADSGRLREVLENLPFLMLLSIRPDANVHISVETSNEAARVNVADMGRTER